MPGTMSPGLSSRSGMGVQNRAIGNSAFQTVGYGESAYGRVAYGPSVSVPGLITPSGTTVAGGPSGGTTINWDLNPEGNATGTPAAAPGATAAASGPDSAYAEQLSRLNADNTELYRQMATLQQQLKAAQDNNQELQQRLVTQGSQLEQYQRLSQEAQQRVQVLQATSGQGGAGFQGAVLRGNNSLTQNMDSLRVPGTSVVADGDVIRVTLPSDFVFQGGTTEFQPGATQVLQQLAGSIRQNYTGQIVRIEAHWDNSAGSGTIGAHQITANQAMAIMNFLTNQNLLPPQQLLVMGYGGNHPTFSNATPQGQAANRRIELVIYPDTF